MFILKIRTCRLTHWRTCFTPTQLLWSPWSLSNTPEATQILGDGGPGGEDPCIKSIDTTLGRPRGDCSPINHLPQLSQHDHQLPSINRHYGLLVTGMSNVVLLFAICSSTPLDAGSCFLRNKPNMSSSKPWNLHLGRSPWTMAGIDPGSLGIAIGSLWLIMSWSTQCQPMVSL